MSKKSRPIQFRYIFDFGSSNREVFNLEIDEATEADDGNTGNFPEWSKLGFAQYLPTRCNRNRVLPGSDGTYRNRTSIGQSRLARRSTTSRHLRGALGRKKNHLSKRNRFLIHFQIATSGCPNVDFSPTYGSISSALGEPG